MDYNRFIFDKSKINFELNSKQRETRGWPRRDSHPWFSKIPWISAANALNKGKWPLIRAWKSDKNFDSIAALNHECSVWQGLFQNQHLLRDIEALTPKFIAVSVMFQNWGFQRWFSFSYVLSGSWIGYKPKYFKLSGRWKFSYLSCLSKFKVFGYFSSLERLF